MEFNNNTIIKDYFTKNDNCFNIDDSQIQELQTSLIKKCFEYHYEQSKEYRAYCQLASVTPADITDYNSLSKIPMLSSSLFKMIDINNNPNGEYECYESSGTKGSVSKVFKDKTTAMHFRDLTKYSLSIYLNVDYENTYGIHLGQSPQYNNLWLSSAIDMVSDFLPLDHMIGEEFKFDTGFVVEQITRRVSENESVILFGAPILVLRLLDYLAANDQKIIHCQNLKIVTAGGWKKFSGETINRQDMYDLLAKYFVGFNSANFSDVYNCAETNNTFSECECHNKHIYPWVNVRLLDPETMSEVEQGEEGIIAILDPTISSYPGFLLTDDIGVMSSDCECGRKGRTLEVIRRVISDEMRGCSLKLDLQSQLKK